MKVTIEQLNRERPVISELRLKSFECEHYLVQLTTETGQSTLVDDTGRPQVFRSQLAAKIPFKGFRVERAVLEHQSYYDEMIGLQGDKVEPLLVDISLPDNDCS